MPKYRCWKAGGLPVAGGNASFKSRKSTSPGRSTLISNEIKSVATKSSPTNVDGSPFVVPTGAGVLTQNGGFPGNIGYPGNGGFALINVDIDREATGCVAY